MLSDWWLGLLHLWFSLGVVCGGFGVWVVMLLRWLCGIVVFGFWFDWRFGWCWFPVLDCGAGLGGVMVWLEVWLVVLMLVVGALG